MTRTLFSNALVFDGTGHSPIHTDIEVDDGHIVRMGRSLSPQHPDTHVIDCTGQWLMPGLLDIHTHLDLEVEIAPELPEVVRHGTTTVVMSNCSLGVAYGNQRRNGEDPIVDCFARVENVPKHVLSAVAQACTWTTSADYLSHFEGMALGPNVVPLIPHSMLRIEVMGLNASVQRDPTADELKRMEQLLEQGMQEGYAGFSTDGLPFHFLANQPNTRKKIPTQFASFSELKRLTQIVRKHNRVWQATPPKDNPLKTARLFLLTSGLLYGKALKTTATAAIDLFTNKGVAKLGLLLSAILNSRLLRGHFRFQALSAQFRLWADGVITPVAEEIPELRVLNELELDDVQGRLKLLNDPAWIKAFRTMWFKGKSGWNLANLMRILNREHNVLNRRLDDMRIADCPLPEWKGWTLEQAWKQVQSWQARRLSPASVSEAEAAVLNSFPSPTRDDAEFFLHLLRHWDLAFRWETVVANRNPAVLKKLLFHPQTLPGFNDSGAHLTNLAFYDGNLRTLKIAQTDGLLVVSQAVHRLTQAPAQFFGLNVGVLAPGAQADLCVINPEALQRWDPESTYAMVYRDAFQCKQVVNRPEGVVTHVMIGGKLGWSEGQYTPVYGREPMGRLLKAA